MIRLILIAASLAVFASPHCVHAGKVECARTRFSFVFFVHGLHPDSGEKGEVAEGKYVKASSVLRRLVDRFPDDFSSPVWIYLSGRQEPYLALERFDQEAFNRSLDSLPLSHSGGSHEENMEQGLLRILEHLEDEKIGIAPVITLVSDGKFSPENMGGTISALREHWAVIHAISLADAEQEPVVFERLLSSPKRPIWQRPHPTSYVISADTLLTDAKILDSLIWVLLCARAPCGARPLLIFETGSTQLTEESIGILDYFIESMLESGYRIFLEGHASFMEEEADSLSLQRALQVKAYLTSKGVREENIFVRSYGSSRPKYDTSMDDDEGKKMAARLNQHVEYSFMPPD